MTYSKRGIYSRFIKRPMDFILAFIAIIILSPLFLIIAMLVRINLGSPVIFKQQRPGLNDRIFTMYKFRTMTNEVDENGKLLPNHKRVTKIGKLLRRLSLDELPQLINVLKGDLSLVGPRPLLKEYLPLYNKEQRRRHEVKPGITGWAQVNGRNAISWEERFKLDVWYVDNQSFKLDLKILFLTVLKVLKRENINPADKQFAEKFKGSSDKDAI